MELICIRSSHINRMAISWSGPVGFASFSASFGTHDPKYMAMDGFCQFLLILIIFGFI